VSRPRRPARPRRGALAVFGALGAGLLLAACSDGPTDPRPTPPVASVAPKVGDLLTINTQSSSACNNPVNRGGRVVAVSNRAIVVADTGNPAGGFTDAEYGSIAATFDTLIYPVDTRLFGAPADIDKNGRVMIFYTRAVNQLTPANVQFIVGGFFIARDLFPKSDQPGFQGCAGSNQGELFYMLVPDPSGAINNNPRSKESVLRSSLATVAHEFQHLINASRRLYVLNQREYYEEVWLNEGLSHIAEEATFYQSAGLSPAGRPGDSPRGDLGSAAFPSSSPSFVALNAYNGSNLGRISSYFKAVQDSTPLGLTLDSSGEPDDDGLATRGAAWAFLRYAADRVNGSDADFFQQLVNGSTLGLANLRAATGAGPALADWFRDWSVANYADNHAAPALDTRFQYRSWNFRSLLPRVTSNNGNYPLVVRPLSDNVARSDSVAGGTAAYYTFTLAGGGSATVRTRGAGGAAPGGAVRLSLVRVTTADAAGGPAVTTYDAGAGADIAVSNPSAGPAQYALVAFNSNLDNPRAKQPVTVTVSGTAGVVLAGAPALNAALRANVQPGPTIAGLRAAANDGLVTTDAPLQERFRQMAERELAGRVAGAQAWYRAQQRQ
jgi:hypothetical protein